MVKVQRGSVSGYGPERWNSDLCVTITYWAGFVRYRSTRDSEHLAIFPWVAKGWGLRRGVSARGQSKGEKYTQKGTSSVYSSKA
ncbi:hypothetical protein E2C01_043259 [Portunus trituberculatus]|uniref:Uncharacterized protein n=1 Tax=Portunus trituberculatus TaxID=210409 RepID=A0A5B7FVL7_PORTR|nr:hypothetical protein [Portunus trituberculatus]